ncbi:GNAT family N-acetyltransferase [Paenibacillus dendritiformis]|uniref:GNAT family N-acetyltransferase n=1 Tax=Paenibacillus dendritiformis TaxID=130049 RepID=UPI0020C3F73C|nr:GNAT family N-acetyltransferase [Paenibacillus dendritiformis]CAH8772632.1 GNAT family N-acetyltransferase [Paenibacillus dendritiformis]
MNPSSAIVWSSGLEGFNFMGSVKSNLNNHESLRLNHVVPYQAVEIDQAFALALTNGEMKNADFLHNYIEQYWGTLDHFLEKGYGYVALTANKEVASLAISSSIYGSTHAIGVETLEDYQRQGLSSSLVKLLLNKFNENKIIAWWDCMESNIASQKTAEKAGLCKTHRYKINWFHF